MTIYGYNAWHSAYNLGASQARASELEHGAGSREQGVTTFPS